MEKYRKQGVFGSWDSLEKLFRLPDFFVCCIVRKHIHCFLGGIVELTG